MRPIEFRAWDKRGNKMFEGQDLIDHRMLISPANGRLLNYMDFSVNYDENFVLMQFTGLLDKNGKKIFEGDIVKYEYWYKELGVVKFGEFSVSDESYCDQGCSFSKDVIGWYAEQLPSKSRNYCEIEELDCGSSFTVVGSVYENPELLKDETK